MWRARPEMSEYRIEDSLVSITKGKEGLRGFGFEPAFNEVYDLYASDKVLSNSIPRMEDIALYLSLHKSVHVGRDDWNPPSIRHLRRKFKISSGKIYAILERLEKAQLLPKQSGVRERRGGTHRTTMRCLTRCPRRSSSARRRRGHSLFPSEMIPRSVRQSEQGVYLRRNKGVPGSEQGCSCRAQ
jgi:hypothetical protein